MAWKKIAEYFLEDPLRLLTLVGGSGGLLFWYDRYKNRTRLSIKIINLGLNQPSDSNKASMKFEVENLGTLPNSLRPSLYLSGITPKWVPNSTGKRYTFEYKLNETDRNLPPNSPVIFEAYSTWDKKMKFMWFIKIKFKATRGRGKTMFIRSFSNEELSQSKYMYGSENGVTP